MQLLQKIVILNIAFCSYQSYMRLITFYSNFSKQAQAFRPLVPFSLLFIPIALVYESSSAISASSPVPVALRTLMKYEYVSITTVIARSNWNAAENGCKCTLSSLQMPS